MNITNKKKFSQSGSIVIMLVIMVLLVVSIVGVMMIDTSQVELEVATSDLIYTRNLFYAESGAYAVTRVISAVVDDDIGRVVMGSNPDWQCQMKYETSKAAFKTQIDGGDDPAYDMRIEFMNGTALIDTQYLAKGDGLINPATSWHGGSGSGESIAAKMPQLFLIRTKGFSGQSGQFCMESKYVKYPTWDRGF